MADTQETGLECAASPQEALVEMIEREGTQEAMRAIAGDYASPERVEVWLRLAARKEPKLYDCTRESVIQAITRAIGMHLEPDGIHGALVVYGREAQFMPMYRGLIKLARDSGEVWAIEAEVVHEGDDFEYALGLNPILRHIPGPNSDPRDVTHAWAIARFRNGQSQFRVCPRSYLDKVQASAQKRGGMVWRTWPEEQQKKTAIKYLSKLLPQTPELIAAIAHDNEVFGGVGNGQAPVPAISTADSIVAALNPPPPPIQNIADTPIEPVDKDAAENKRRLKAHDILAAALKADPDAFHKAAAEISESVSPTLDEWCEHASLATMRKLYKTLEAGK